MKERQQFLIHQKNNNKEETINQVIQYEEEGVFDYQKQTVFGFKINTDGLGMSVEFGRRKNNKNTNLYRIELGERKHPKEEKTAPVAQSALRNNYVYGKINNFYYSKFGIAQQKLIGTKGNKNGIEVTAIYGGGISAGLLKPYYIKIGRSRIIEDVKYNNNDADFLDNPQSVYGATGFTKGLNEIKLTPGAFVKTAIRFDYARYNDFVSAIETGLNVEVYSKKMQQMLLVKNQQLFYNVYVGFLFGRRK